MNNSWIRLGCFLIGYKYSRLKHCSVASEKTVKKYTSAILLICMLWAFIGYAFTNLYIIDKDTQSEILKIIISLFGSAIMVIAVIQIERQIILSDRTNQWARISRIVIGFVMAIIGSIIIDQILFHKDIETEDIKFIERTADSSMPELFKLINEHITTIDGDNAKIQNEKDSLSANYNKNPVLESPTIINTLIPRTVELQDKNGNEHDTIIFTNQTTRIPNTIENPSGNRAKELQQIIERNNDKKDTLIASKQTARVDKIKELKENRGFLTELTALGSLLFHSGFPEAFFVWIVFWILFFAIELLVLAIKFFDKNNDYEEAIQNQMEIRINQLNALKSESAKIV